MIHRIKTQTGSWVEEDGDIATKAIRFFSGLYSEAVVPSDELLPLIPPVLTREENLTLEHIPSMDEVKRVVHAMDGNSAVGPDDFTSNFFTFAWDIIAQDVYNAMSGFVRGRNITENYLLAQEIVAGIEKKARGGNVVLKLDMAKAYDRVSWFYLIRVLRKFGFGERFIDMVWRLVSNVWFSVMINGAAYGFFKSNRDLRQGDPLSPALFVIAAKVLSQGLNNLATHPSYHGFRVSQGCPGVTYLAFADDMLILVNGSSAFLRQVMRVLNMYQHSFGQMLNAQKSGYLVHSSLSSARRKVIKRITGFSRQTFPTGYLGFPLYVSRCKTTYFAEVCQKVLEKILSWKTKFLSSGGRLILIKHVLFAIPLHLLSAAVMPKAVFRVIERACANFLWGSSEEDLRYHWIGWAKLCLPPEEGGRGFAGLRTYIRLSLTSFGRQVELSMLWLVQNGSCHFRYDNWLGSGALFLKTTVASHLSFRDFITQGHWNAQLLAQVLSRDVMFSVLGKPVPSEQITDKVVWMPERSEKFSLASAYHEVWHLVAMGALTLNTDGCSKGNPGIGGSGGVLRDPAGRPLVGFSAFFGETSSLQAEALALLTGLRVCAQQGFTDVRVQLDFMFWWGFLHDSFTVLGTSTGRETNKVADILANVGVAHPHHVVKIYEYWSESSRMACGGIGLDSMGLPSVRRVRNP
ncbi:uncharacterized protein LOC113782066 [Coffea eugenioides]|uniref:uncharacterized protein LOC113782066 n=1 Tax=Coffea eugenioides TaxID=49369 RepID=UPI000F6111BE|nr:uncharacterized protein LOC113782066 [Coffea eugenioides]